MSGLSKQEREGLDGGLEADGCYGFLGDHHGTIAAVEHIVSARVERIVQAIDDLALTMVSTASDEGTALTAAILQKAARIAREFGGQS